MKEKDKTNKKETTGMKIKTKEKEIQQEKDKEIKEKDMK